MNTFKIKYYLVGSLNYFTYSTDTYEHMMQLIEEYEAKGWIVEII